MNIYLVIGPNGVQSAWTSLQGAREVQRIFGEDYIVRQMTLHDERVDGIGE